MLYQEIYDQIAGYCNCMSEIDPCNVEKFISRCCGSKSSIGGSTKDKGAAEYVEGSAC